MNLYRILIVTIFIITGLYSSAQVKNKISREELDTLSRIIPALNERIDFTVNELPLQEFMRGIANEAGLNINLDPGLNELVTNNFTNVQVKDLLLFVQENYDVEINIIGSILNIRKIETPKPIIQQTILVTYDSEDNTVTFEMNNAPIQQVAREITKQTGQNVVVTPGARNIIVNTFIKDMPFASAMEKLAVGNDCRTTKTSDGYYLIEELNRDTEVAQSRNMNTRNGPRMNSNNSSSEPSYLKVTTYRLDSIDVKAENAELKELLVKIFEPLHQHYQLIGDINDLVTIDVKGIDLDALLNDVFAGTNTASRKMNGVYWIGPRNVLDMQEVKMFRMKYRTIDSIVYIIPKNLKDGIEIIEYPDLNSLILAGARDGINNLCEFLRTVDQVIPVILIEVMFIDNNDSKALSTGISAGLADEPTVTSGSVLPSVDMTLGANTVNNLIDGLNGFGWVNLGRVNSNFYMKLQALEEDGVIDMRSTPQLSTLNGHKASLTIGNTEYYKEEMNMIYGTVTSSSQKTTTYKPVEAELKLEIFPLVAGNQEVTLKIMVEQSDFTERIEKNAPPGKVSRKFESMIRVKDQEMILLGGLEEATKRDTRSGVPILASIPILKWIFSSTSKVKSQSKLNIFIKPTIIN